MNAVDKRAIEFLAAAKTYHGRERPGAVEAYFRGIKNGELDASPHMLFMSEVCNEVPDLMLRSKYRAQVLKGYKLP